MFSRSHSTRRRTIGALIGVGTLVAATQVGGLASPPVQAIDDPATTDIVEWQSPVEVFSTDDIIGSSDIPEGETGNREAQDPSIVLGNDDGEFDGLNFVSQGGNMLSPIDNSFTTDELDFFGATGRDRDGDPLTGEGYDEGFAGNIVDAGEVVGLEVSDVATDLFKAGAPLGTWAAGLGGESIKASTEHFTVMESILTCYQTNPYDFWKSESRLRRWQLSVPVPQRDRRRARCSRVSRARSCSPTRTRVVEPSLDDIEPERGLGDQRHRHRPEQRLLGHDEGRRQAAVPLGHRR